MKRLDKGYIEGTESTTAKRHNLAYGGQGGHLLALGRKGGDGVNYAEWINSAPYMSTNVIAIVEHYPKGFDLLPNSDVWIAEYKAMIELHPLDISGLDFSLAVETGEIELGGDGAKFTEILSISRNQSAVSFAYNEMANKTITKFMDKLYRYIIRDPDTNHPLVRNYVTDIDTIGGIYGPEYRSGTVMFIEPDALQRKVVDALRMINFQYTNAPERTMKKVRTGAGEFLEVSLEATGISRSDESVLALAQIYLDRMNVLDLTPDVDLTIPAEDSVDANLEASGVGFNHGGT